MSVGLDGEELGAKRGYFGRREAGVEQTIEAARCRSCGRSRSRGILIVSPGGLRSRGQGTICISSGFGLFGKLSRRESISYRAVHVDSCRLWPRIPERLLALCLVALFIAILGWRRNARM